MFGGNDNPEEDEQDRKVFGRLRQKSMDVLMLPLK
jgi:hypothetical protein